MQDEKREVDERGSSIRRSFGARESICALVEICGNDLSGRLMGCIEGVVSRTAAMEQGKVWVDLERVPTSREASEPLILNAIEKTMHQAVSKGMYTVRAGYFRLGADRTIVALSGPSNRIRGDELIALIGRVAEDYGSGVGLGVKSCAPDGNIHPRGVTVPFQFSSHWSRSEEQRLECLQRVIAAHCVVVWLIAGSDVFDVDVSTSAACIAASNSLLSLTFDFSDRPSVREVFEKVKNAMSGSQVGYSGMRRTGAPIRSAVIRSNVPTCTLNVGELRFSVLSLALTGQWRAKTELIEHGSSVVVTCDCDVLDGQTIGDLLIHIDRCLDFAPDALASEISLVST